MVLTMGQLSVQWQSSSTSSVQKPLICSAGSRQYFAQLFKRLLSPDTVWVPSLTLLGRIYKSAPLASGGWRITEDASFPPALEQHYERWSCVVDHFARAGSRCFFLQWDKADAYRSVPIRVQDQHLTGFFVPDFGFCFSPTMPFGFSSSA